MITTIETYVFEYADEQWVNCVVDFKNRNDTFCCQNNKILFLCRRCKIRSESRKKCVLVDQASTDYSKRDEKM